MGSPATRNPAPEIWAPKPEAQNPDPETRLPKPETWIPNSGSRNSDPETRIPKPETRNPGGDECIRAWDLRRPASHAYTLSTGNLKVRNLAWHQRTTSLLVTPESRNPESLHP